MPRFFSAPPMPVPSWHLKCVRLTIASASTTARPMRAWSQYSPPTGTLTKSVPSRPSAMITWQPVCSGEKPLRYAASMWSSAFRRMPGYRVLLSVRNGRAPIPFSSSTTALA